MNKNKISVIMAVYKEPLEYLKLSIDSILTQSYSNLEFLIINDNPEDNILDSFIRSCDDPRIKYYRNDKNLGLASCLNNLIRKTSGEFIARMDADDISHKDRFEKQLAYLKANEDVYLLGSRAIFIDDSGDILPIERYDPLDYEEVKILTFRICVFHHFTVVFRRDVFFKYNFFYDESEDFKYAEDYELWSRLVFRLKACNLEDRLGKYRFSKIQISSVRKSEQICAANRVRASFANSFFKQIGLDLSIPKVMDLSFIKKLNKAEKNTYHSIPKKSLKKIFGIIRRNAYLSLDKYTVYSFFYFLFSFNYLRYPRDLRPTLKIILKHFFSRRRWHKFY